MKLTDLKPHWIGFGKEWNQIKTGISFLSPLGTGQRLGVLFSNPIDPLNLGWNTVQNAVEHPVDLMHQSLWQRSGEDFESLTLTPSLDFSKYREWHGFITSGEIK